MTTLLAALAVSTNVLCSVCGGSGLLSLPCPDCRGVGVRFFPSRGNSYGFLVLRLPCRRCYDASYGPRSFGTGRIHVVCPSCGGLRYVLPSVKFIDPARKVNESVFPR